MNNPLVVGYKGEIGSFILNGLLKIMPKALNIWCIDINETSLEVTERINTSDIIFLCIPMQNTIDWIVKWISLLMGKIIIEQCSLKEWIYDDPRLKDLDIRSMHIMFRPSQTPNIDDRSVGLFQHQFDNYLSDTISKITQSKIVWYNDQKDHDKDMAIQQALLHRTLLLLGDILQLDIARGCNGRTYISKKVLELVSRIKKGNKELYSLIQKNKYLPEILKDFKTTFNNFDINNYFGDK